jgi:hypothetical protein
MTTGEKLALTPLKNVSASISDTSQKVPGEVILALNDRNPSYHDLYLANLTTGDKKLLIKNDNFSYFALDNDYNIRFAGNTTPGGGEMVYRRLDNGSGSQYMKLKLGLEEESSTGVIGFSRNNSIMYMVDSHGRDTSALTATNMTTGIMSTIGVPRR